VLYYVSVGGCLFLLTMMPIWSARNDNPSYPFIVILMLAALAIAVPLFFRVRKPRRRKGDWLG
jgi:hypothetical protein